VRNSASIVYVTHALGEFLYLADERCCSITAHGHTGPLRDVFGRLAVPALGASGRRARWSRAW
jgi:hypothetical protein